MDPAGALSELGLTPPTSEEAIRRAYLKGVRAHPPERDPEGFRRVREAYELLKGAPWFWQAIEQEPRVEPEPEPESESEPEPELEPELESDEFVPSDDPQRYARSLIDRMASGSSDAGVNPWLALDCALTLFQRGESSLGAELLTRFGTWTANTGVRVAELGAPSIARWALLRELANLHPFVDRGVVVALAKSVRSAQFFEAADVLTAAHARQGASLEDLLRKKAPTLYAAVWPMVRTSEVTPAFRTKKALVWPWFGTMFFALQIFRLCASSADEDRPARSRPAIALSATATARARALDVSEASSMDAHRRQLEGVGRAVDAAIALGDCGALRDQWPLYLAASDDADRSRTARREAVLQLCPEFGGELPGESP